MPHARFTSWLLLPCLALFAFLALPWPGALARSRPVPEGPPAAPGDPRQHRGALQLDAPGAGLARPPPAAQPVLGAMVYDPAAARYVASAGGGRAALTLSPGLQQGLERLLAEYQVPTGAVVLLEPRTGKVLAMAERSEAGSGARVALTPMAPAASVFKIVTSAALLERGLSPEQEVCFHGGQHRIQKALLRDDPRRDRRCLTLTEALGKSANVVFAKMAGRELSPGQLRAEADRFLFNRAIPFAWPVEPSTALISEDPFELATTAAGFGPVRMSPLHAALIAAIVANGGRYVPPRIVEAVDGVPAPAPGAPRQIIRPEVAAALARMMESTTTEGTARKWYRRDQRSRSSPLRGVSVAGKTGSLAEAEPYRDYSWFVGFAPVEDPQIAVAAVVVNQRLWHARASLLAHEALKSWFAEESRAVRTARR